MVSFNKVVLVGNLSREPELKFTNDRGTGNGFRAGREPGPLQERRRGLL